MIRNIRGITLILMPSSIIVVPEIFNSLVITSVHWHIEWFHDTAFIWLVSSSFPSSASSLSVFHGQKAASAVRTHFESSYAQYFTTFFLLFINCSFQSTYRCSRSISVIILWRKTALSKKIQFVLQIVHLFLFLFLFVLQMLELEFLFFMKQFLIHHLALCLDKCTLLADNF